MVLSQMAGRVTTVTALLLLVITRVSGGGQPFFFYSGAPAPVVPQFYVYDTQLVAAPVAPEPARSGVPLPCPAEGFHRHPTNCSRFYRCVDYAGTGQYFSRYEFQCPPGQMFLSVGKDTCVPGDCAGVVPLPAAPVGAVDPGNYGQGSSGIPPSTGHVGDDPGSYPQPVTASQPTESAAPVAGGAYPQPGGSPPAGSAGVGPVVVGSYQTQSPPTEAPTPPAGTGGSVPPAYPQPGEVATPAYPEQVTAAQTPPVGYPEPVTPAPPPPPPPVGYPKPVTPAPPSVAYPQPGGGDGGCPARYVQDSQFCNIYHRCPDDRERFLCISGTVFDQARQMCRINDREDVCFGKQMYFPSAAFRADFPQLNQGGPAQLVGEQTFPSFTQRQSLPLFSQGQPSPVFSREQSLPLFSQVQSFPEFSQGQPFPTFGQGQPFPTFDHGQPFPTFDQGQTFQSFDQEPTFPATQRLGYTAQIPSYSEVSGVPQFAASDFVSGQGTSSYAQPSYIVPNYFVSSK